MQRRNLVAAGMTVASVLGTGGLAVAVGGDAAGTSSVATLPAGSTGPDPSIVIERLFDDTFVVVPGRRAAVPAAGSTAARRTAGAASDAAPTGLAGGAPTTAPPSTAPRKVAPAVPAGGATTTTTPKTPTTKAPPSTAPSTSQLGATSTTTRPPATTTSVVTQPATYTSAGGSFTLTWTADALHVTSTSPAAGYRAQVQGRGTEIHVIFASSDRDIEITITLVDGNPRVRGL
jgi:hypothetical protein